MSYDFEAMSAERIPDYISPEAYLEWEASSEERHEYIDGVVVRMVGESKNHHRVERRIRRRVEDRIKSSKCEAFRHGIRVVVNFAEFQTIYYYPDIVVDCGVDDSVPEPVTGYVANQPKLIIEILSPRSKRKDEVEKYSAYQYLPTLEEYLVVNQDPDERWARLHRREFNWRPQTGDIVVGSGEIHLRSIDLKLDLDEIYDFS